MKPAKILAVGLTAAIAWIVNWWLLKDIIYHNQPLTFIGWPSLATIIGITFLTFFFLINKNWIISAVLNIVILAGYLLIMPKNVYVLLGGGIFLVFLYLFELRILTEEKSRADFSIRRVMADSISLTVYALLLLIGFNVYFATATEFKANPEAYYAKLEKATSKTVPYITRNIQELSDEEKQALNEQVAAQTVGKIKESVSNYQKYFPFIFAIIVTATLWTFVFLLRWATMIIGSLIFRLLVLVGFFKLHKVQVEVEKLSI